MMARERVANDKVWQHGKKRCSGCKRYQSPEAYCSNKNSKDGLNPRCRDCAFEDQLRINFKLTSAQYYKMLTDQDGCAICGVESCSTGRRFAVDHDHACCPGTKSCGECVRSLLCQRCNQAIGLLNDDADRIRRAADYLDRWSK